MNNTPENQNRTYTDYSIDGTQKPRQAPRQTAQPRQAPPQNGQYRASRPTVSAPQANRNPAQRPMQAQQTQPRRPLTDEERRRLEAARMAAKQQAASGGISAEEAMRRRRMEQQRLSSAQPNAPVRTRPPQNPNDPRLRDPSGRQDGRSASPQPRRRKKRMKINIGAVLFVLMIAGVIGVSMHQIDKNEEAARLDANTPPVSETTALPEDAYLGDTLHGDAPIGGTETAAETTAPENEPNLTLFNHVTVSNETMDEGNLILVNYAYSYADADNRILKNAYLERTGKLKVAATDIGMTEEAFAALEEMVIALTTDTGCDDLLIVSGHRTIESQQRIYNDYLASHGEEYVKQYVANPGYSEHHTGLACDLSFYTDDGYSVPIADHEFGYWLGDNCMKLGFIRRYPEDKVNFTQIAYEAWHFRYVGLPHAYACTAMDYCLEEYIDAIRAYTPDTKMLYIQADGTVADATLNALPTSGGWLTYFVPAEEGAETNIRVPRGDVYADYEISGNNVDGYIVTVTLP